MPDAFSSSIAAVLDDDRARLKTLLEQNPGMARHGVADDDQYADGIAHWIYSGDSLLHVAAAAHRVEITGELLGAGADADAARNRRASRPLHYAADCFLANPSWSPVHQVATIRLLLEAGAAIDAQDKNGATPLHRAVRTRGAAAVKCLLAAGADPTVRNKPGSTAFHLAVQNTGRGGSGSELARTAQREIIDAFLDQGIRPSLRDAKGRSVLESARSDWIHRVLTGETIGREGDGAPLP
jgi:Ankyrin repeats (3 copies)